MSEALVTGQKDKSHNEQTAQSDVEQQKTEGVATSVGARVKMPPIQRSLNALQQAPNEQQRRAIFRTLQRAYGNAYATQVATSFSTLQRTANLAAQTEPATTETASVAEVTPHFTPTATPTFAADSGALMPVNQVGRVTNVTPAAAKPTGRFSKLLQTKPLQTLARLRNLPAAGLVNRAQRATATVANFVSQRQPSLAATVVRRARSVANSNLGQRFKPGGKTQSGQASGNLRQTTPTNNSANPTGLAAVPFLSRLIQREAATCPPPPVDKPAPNAEEHPGFQQVKAKAKQVATQEKKHEPAQAKAKGAQDAAQPPANDLSSQAAAAQVGEMGKQKPGAFDKAAFVAAVTKAIEEAAPKTAKDAAEYRSSGKAQNVRGAVGGIVTQNKEASQKDIKTATQQAPDQSKATPKPVTPMKPEEPGAPPASITAEKAVPDPKGKEEINLDNTKCQTDDQMKEANVTGEQMKKANEPEFDKALNAKKEADTNAATAPQQFKAQEQAVIGETKNEAKASAEQNLGAMHGTRSTALNSATGQQNQTKNKDEQQRRDFAVKLEGIYKASKTKVEEILKGLDEKVNKAFEVGEDTARKKFEQEVSDETLDFKLRRYLSQPGGLLLWAVDELTSPPAELNRIIERARNRYLENMKKVINEVAEIVGRELTAAKDEIENGRKAVQKEIDALPANLKQLGQEAQQNFAEKFNELEQSVNEKQQAMVESLAEKYNEAREKIDERASEMKEKNKGLLDQAKDAIGGVIKTILQLKDMLMGVLAKAASAVDKIIKDPIGFLGNLVTGIKMGLDRFLGNIGEHLKKGLMNWLLGQIGDTGIVIPKTFDFMSILNLVLQILGLTFEKIRAKVMAKLGPKAAQIMDFIEKGFAIFQILKSGGIQGLINFLLEKLSDLKDSIIGQIWDMILESVVKAGIKWLIGLLNPASALIKAAIAIVDIVTFFIERGSQIMSLVNAILDSITAIADGALDGAAAMVENALAKAIPVAIGFLASLLGIGDIGNRIKGIITNLQKKVGKVVDKVIDQAIKYGKKFLGKLKGLFGKKDKKKDDPQKQKKIEAGLKQLHQEEAKYLKDGKIEQKNAKKVASTVKGANPVFKSIKVVDGGKNWNYSYVAKTTEEGGKKDEFETEIVTAPNGKQIVCAKQGSVLVPVEKVTIYCMGKVAMYPKEELDQLQKMKQNNRKEFDKNPENEERLKHIRDNLKHNYERSQEMFESIKNVGMVGSVEDIKNIMSDLLSTGEKVTLETRVKHPSAVEAPQGQLKVLSTWKILPDGRKYLSTINFVPTSK